MYLSLLKGSARFTTAIPVEVLGFLDIFILLPSLQVAVLKFVVSRKNYTPSEGLEITAHFKEFLNKDILSLIHI